MHYFNIEKLEDLEVLIDKLVKYYNTKDLTINDVKEQSRIITFLTQISRYTISLATIYELYSESDKKEVIYYVLNKLTELKNRDKLINQFKEKYLTQSEDKEKEIQNIEENVEQKEVKTILENDVNLLNIVREVENEVKHISVKKLDENELEELKSFSVITDDERSFIRGETIESKKIVKIISGGKIFEVKENNDIIIIKIPSKAKLIIDKNVVFDYDGEEKETNIFPESEENYREVSNISEENIKFEENQVITKKKRGRKPKNKTTNLDVENNETIKRILGK